LGTMRGQFSLAVLLPQHPPTWAHVTALTSTQDT
jgi:hypothetical protein